MKMQIDEAHDRAIKAELEKLIKLNPNSIALYIIINEPDESKLPDDPPIMLFNKQLKVKDLVDKMKKKYQKYGNVYLFGKDRSLEERAELSLKQKRRQKNKLSTGVQYEGQKVIHLQQEQLEYTIGYAHQRYKNDDNLLVVVVSEKPLPKPSFEPAKFKLKQTLYVLGALLFVLFYLYLVLSGDKSTEKESTNPSPPTL